MTNYQERWINILDRQYNLINDANPEAFWWELVQFLDFISNNEPFSPYIRQMQREFREMQEDYVAKLKQQVEELARIRQDFAIAYPTQDDSNMAPPVTQEL